VAIVSENFSVSRIKDLVDAWPSI